MRLAAYPDSALAMEDARRLLAQIIEETKALGHAGERLSDDQAPVPGGESHETIAGSVADQMKLDRDPDADQESPMPRGGRGDIAVQHEGEEREPDRPEPRRRHGGALPD